LRFLRQSLPQTFCAPFAVGAAGTVCLHSVHRIVNAISWSVTAPAGYADHPRWITIAPPSPSMKR
jgi:hypothetical protein